MRTALKFPDAAPFAGIAGCIWSQSGLAVGLAAFAALLAVNSITTSQAHAACLAGGERTLRFNAMRLAFPAALAGAALGGVIALSDAGPGMLLDLRTTAGEILTAFAARYDAAEASRLCFSLAAAGLLMALPVLNTALSVIEPAFVGREVGSRASPRAWGEGRVGAVLFVPVAFLCVMPLAGLLLPLFGGMPLERAWSEIRRTATDTFLYATGSGLIAVLAALLIAVWTGRHVWRQRLVLTLLFISLAVPPAWPALMWIQWINAAPASLDWLTRGRFPVCLSLAMRFVAVAFVLILRRWNAFPRSGSMAAKLHGVPRFRFFYLVMFPHLATALATAAGLVAILASGEITLTLLLHPPGEQSLPLAIFTIMANAPEALVATLCLVYVASVVCLLSLLLSRRRRS